IPLALLFAFLVLFVRGKSANLLSIGAVDFGIIVDSTVIMVENIYRHISAGEHKDLPLGERIIRASGEVEKSLFFSTIIMVCACSSSSGSNRRGTTSSCAGSRPVTSGSLNAP